jgi:hypothetical protein
LIGDSYVYIANSRGFTVNSLQIVDPPSNAPEPAYTSALGLLLLVGTWMSRRVLVLARQRRLAADGLAFEDRPRQRSLDSAPSTLRSNR